MRKGPVAEVPGGAPFDLVTSITRSPGGGAMSTISWSLLDDASASGGHKNTVNEYVPSLPLTPVTSGPGGALRLIGMGIARTRTPATPAPLVTRLARPWSVRSIGAPGKGVAVGAAVGDDTTLAVGSGVVWTWGVGEATTCAPGEQDVATTASVSRSALRRMFEQ